MHNLLLQSARTALQQAFSDYHPEVSQDAELGSLLAHRSLSASLEANRESWVTTRPPYASLRSSLTTFAQGIPSDSELDDYADDADLENHAYLAMVEAADHYRSVVSTHMATFAREPWTALGRLMRLLDSALQERTLRQPSAHSGLDGQADSADVVLKALGQILQQWKRLSPMLLSSAQQLAGKTMNEPGSSTAPASGCTEDVSTALRHVVVQELMRSASLSHDYRSQVLDLLTECLAKQLHGDLDRADQLSMPVPSQSPS